VVLLDVIWSSMALVLGYWHNINVVILEKDLNLEIPGISMLFYVFSASVVKQDFGKSLICTSAYRLPEVLSVGQ
jgi:hypothetical protein